MKRRWGGRKDAGRGRAQTADAKGKHELSRKGGRGFLNSSTSGQKHTSYYVQTIYVHICTSHIYKSVWILICLIIMVNGELGTFCEMPISDCCYLGDIVDLLSGNCNIHNLASLWSCECWQSWNQRCLSIALPPYRSLT